MVKRIAVIGPCFTGKSSLIYSYLQKPWSDSYISTICGDAYKDKHGNIIWDSPGKSRFQSRFANDNQSIYKQASGFILTFNPSDDESFFNALAVADEANVNEKPIVIAATYSDIEAFNIKPTWSAEASVRGWKIIRTSAKNKIGVTHIFQEIFNQTTESDNIDIGRIEYAKEVVGSCIYSGFNNYIYELDTTNS